MIILWIGMGGWPLHYDGFPQVEVMAAAKHLGRDRVLAVLRGQPPGSDPDIKPINTGWQPGDQYYVMSRFLLSHTKDLLIPSTPDLLLTIEARSASETTGTNFATSILADCRGQTPAGACRPDSG